MSPVQALSSGRSLSAAPSTAEATVTVRRGDTLSAIAARHGVSLQSLIEANPQLPDPDRIRPGQVLALPAEGRGGMFTVSPGDTLSALAARHGVSLQALIAANPQLADPDRIQPGQVLALPVGGPAPRAPATLDESARYELYAGQVRAHGDAGAVADLEAGRRVIVAVRHETDVRANQGRGVYDDRMVVLWRDADGTRHAVELQANADPSGQYEDGGPFMRRAVGGNYGGDARGDSGRLAEGTYVHTRGRFLGEAALLGGNDQVTERDTNHNGRFDDGVRTARGSYGMHIHVGGESNTWSAGCLTLAPAEHARLFQALGAQNTVRTVLVDAGRLQAAEAAPAAPAAPAAAPGRTLTEADWQRAAATLGVDVAAIRAVAEVEARRSGFLADGRPKILFEAHQFSDRTGGRFDRSHPDISSPRWNRSLYVGGAGEYPRLEAAMALDREAALESASWGRFQIMGFNHAAAGFDDVESFVTAMREGEGRQLDAFVSFIASHPGMHAALQRHDWAAFAAAYNGPGYAENQYDTRMAEAYRRFAH